MNYSTGSSPFPIDKHILNNRPALVTGGAGFIGVNVVKALLDQGVPVIILDNLSRNGTEKNIAYLQQIYSKGLEVIIGDVLDSHLVEKLVGRCAMVFHFAAQVAVTTSIENPVQDFEVNCRGTLNVLEAARKQLKPPGVLFTSTNKVYGDLSQIRLLENQTRYVPADAFIFQSGITEDHPLDLYSPYGCSKGAADQYVLDYARIFGLPTVVFRMSCIYGPHQLGTEDQGWVAHFMIQMQKDEGITIYGDGKQVRDLLYVDDLVQAMLMAQSKVQAIKGQVFNMGGGPANSVSVAELIENISRLQDQFPDIRFGDWRQGDQLYYVSNTDRFTKATGWKPSTDYRDGLKKLSVWLNENATINTSTSRIGIGE